MLRSSRKGMAWDFMIYIKQNRLFHDACSVWWWFIFTILFLSIHFHNMLLFDSFCFVHVYKAKTTLSKSYKCCSCTPFWTVAFIITSSCSANNVLICKGQIRGAPHIHSRLEMECKSGLCTCMHGLYESDKNNVYAHFCICTNTQF